MTDYPERDLLRSIEPAPAVVDDVARIRNLHTVLHRVHHDIAPVRRHRFRWLRIGLPLAAVVTSAALAVPLVLPETDSIQSPMRSVSTAVPGALRVGSLSTDGTRILARATVDDATFLLGRRGSETRFGASFDGSDPNQNWEALHTAVDIAPRTITVENPGNFPDRNIATVMGQAGADVTSIIITTGNGQQVRASLGNGYYVAAWHGTDFTEADSGDRAFTLQFADGTTTTTSYSAMSAD